MRTTPNPPNKTKKRRLKLISFPQCKGMSVDGSGGHVQRGWGKGVRTCMFVGAKGIGRRAMLTFIFICIISNDREAKWTIVLMDEAHASPRQPPGVNINALWVFKRHTK